MHRFFDELEYISKENLHHMQVLRITDDEEFELVRDGRVFIAKKSENKYKIVKELGTISDNLELNLYFGLLKGQKNDEVLKKCTEIGVKNFYPVLMDRSISDFKNLENKLKRWQKIVKSASEQCKRNDIPSINPIYKSDEIDLSKDPILLYENEEKNLFKREIQGGEISIIVGPEGGISDRELELFKNLRKISLGKNILRAETASIAMSFYIIYGSLNAKDI